MGTQLLPLCWTTHQEEIFAIFQQLLQDEILVDVTLACEGASLKAHKMILSAYSPFFRKLFLENPSSHPIVIMKDIKYRDLKRIVDFMYHGSISISPNELSEFVKTAETLKVKGILETVNTNDLNPTTCATQQEQVSRNSAESAQCSLSYQRTSHHSFMAEEEQTDQSTQQSVISDFMTVDVSNMSNESEHVITTEVKSEPNSNEVSCEELATSHLSEDSISSVHYESTSVPHSVIKDENKSSNSCSVENEVISNCPQEFTIERSLPQFSEVTNQDIRLPSVQINSAESLGVIMREDPTSILQYMPLEHSNLADQHIYNQGATTIPRLKPLEEPTVFSVSNQLHSDCIPVDSTIAHALEKSNLNDWKDMRGHCSSNQSRDGRKITLPVQNSFEIGQVVVSDYTTNAPTVLLVDESQVSEKIIDGNASKYISGDPTNENCSRKHSRLKHLVCDVCGARFSTSYVLSRHKIIHTGERPFQCKICCKKFARKDNFRAHRLLHFK